MHSEPSWDDFETEQTGYANGKALSVDVQLRPAPIRIDDEISKKAKGRNTRALLAPFVDPAILGEIVKDEGRTYVRLREV